eukprot:464483_1
MGSKQKQPELRTRNQTKSTTCHCTNPNIASRPKIQNIETYKNRSFYQIMVDEGATVDGLSPPKKKHKSRHRRSRKKRSPCRELQDMTNVGASNDRKCDDVMEIDAQNNDNTNGTHRSQNSNTNQTNTDRKRSLRSHKKKRTASTTDIDEMNIDTGNENTNDRRRSMRSHKKKGNVSTKDEMDIDTSNVNTNDRRRSLRSSTNQKSTSTTDNMNIQSLSWNEFTEEQKNQLKPIWIKEREWKILKRGRMLTDSHIGAAHKILKTMYPNAGGLQNTLLNQIHSFDHVEVLEAVQILHCGSLNHWICAVKSSNGIVNTVKLIDSAYDRKSGITDGIKIAIAQVCDCILLSIRKPDLFAKSMYVSSYLGMMVNG